MVAGREVDDREGRRGAELGPVGRHRDPGRPRRHQPLDDGVVERMGGDPRRPRRRRRPRGAGGRAGSLRARPARPAPSAAPTSGSTWPPRVTSRTPSRSTSAAAITGAWVTTVTPGTASRSAQASVVVPASMNTVMPGSTSRASAAPSAALAAGASRRRALTGPLGRGRRQRAAVDPPAAPLGRQRPEVAPDGVLRRRVEPRQLGGDDPAVARQPRLDVAQPLRCQKARQDTSLLCEIVHNRAESCSQAAGGLRGNRIEHPFDQCDARLARVQARLHIPARPPASSCVSTDCHYLAPIRGGGRRRRARRREAEDGEGKV